MKQLRIKPLTETDDDSTLVQLDSGQNEKQNLDLEAQEKSGAALDEQIDLDLEQDLDLDEELELDKKKHKKPKTKGHKGQKKHHKKHTKKHAKKQVVS